MTRFDAHIHLFERGYSGTRAPGAELADYLRLRQRHGIGRALVVGYEGEPQFAGNNDYVLGLASTRPWIVPLYFVDPRSVTVDEVEWAVSRGARGLSLYLGADPTLAGHVPSTVWAACAAHRLPLSVNAAPPALASLVPVAAALRDAPLLLSHLGLPGRPPHAAPRSMWSSGLRRLARHRNVLVKLSGLYAIDPVFPHRSAEDDVREAVSAFGAHRLVWGSDFSPGLDVLSGDELFALPDWAETLLGEARDQVLGSTLQRTIEEP
jgi:predicted TIM-barrel fold metal-dependent hydrolase